MYMSKESTLYYILTGQRITTKAGAIQMVTTATKYNSNFLSYILLLKGTSYITPSNVTFSKDYTQIGQSSASSM